VVRAGIAHAKTLAALHAAAFPQEPWDEKTFATLLAQPSVTAQIDPRGGLLLLRVAADEAEILTIGATTPRQGIGTNLMQTAITDAQNAGAASLYLEVAADNQPAISLYRKLQFETAGRRKNYYANQQDALVLRLQLAAKPPP